MDYCKADLHSQQHKDQLTSMKTPAAETPAIGVGQDWKLQVVEEMQGESPYRMRDPAFTSLSLVADNFNRSSQKALRHNWEICRRETKRSVPSRLKAQLL